LLSLSQEESLVRVQFLLILFMTWEMLWLLAYQPF
jgi:hypothetical protein